MSGTERDESDEIDAEEFLATVGFDEEITTLTRRQAKVLVMRETGHTQATIADHLGTSRANVTGIEARARENLEKARETVAFAELLAAPVRIEIPAETDLYDVPDRVFAACDDAGVKVSQSAPELMKLVSDAAGDAVSGRQVKRHLSVSVSSDGTVRVRTA